VAEIADPRGAAEQIGSDGQTVLLDIRLNGINGLDVLRDIRERHPYLPVVLMTGYRQEMREAVDEALSLCAYTWIYKPVQIEELVRVLVQIHLCELGRILGRSASKGRKGGRV
jgi:DNA-binding NtrC family response regulator